MAKSDLLSAVQNVLYGEFQLAFTQFEAVNDIVNTSSILCIFFGIAAHRVGREELALRYMRLGRSRIATDPDVTRWNIMAIEGALNFAGDILRKDDHSKIMRAIAESGVVISGRIASSLEYFKLGVRPSGAHPMQNPDLFHLDGCGEKFLWINSEIKKLEKMRHAFSVIKREYLASGDRDVEMVPYIQHAAGSTQSQAWVELNNSTKWKVIHLWRDGIECAGMRTVFPLTMGILDSLGMACVEGMAPNVMFSVLEPGAVIKPHYGSVNGRLIVHLPLIVPPNCGYLEVCSTHVPWIEGEIFAFDDTFIHSAHNLSTQERVVLIFDIWHPELAGDEREILKIIWTYLLRRNVSS